MKKDTIKVAALAIAGALVSVVSFVVGMGAKETVYLSPVNELDNNETEDDEEIAQDTK